MNCTVLQSIKLPSTLNEIGDYAFYNCASLRELVLNNDGLKEIGENAFYCCSSLQSITFPSTLTDIGNCAFHSCRNLREVVIRMRRQGLEIMHLLAVQLWKVQVSQRFN